MIATAQGRRRHQTAIMLHRLATRSGFSALLFVAVLFGLLVGAGSKAQAVVLQPDSELRKLSLHLRGRNPDLAEYRELSDAIARGEERLFMRSKAHAYMATPEHAQKMSFRLEELFRLQTDPQSELADDPLLPGVAAARIPPYQRVNALNELFFSIARENRSWDELLTGKRYTLRSAPYGQLGFSFHVGDYGFYGAVAADRLPAAVDGAVRSLVPTVLPDRTELTFADDDPRVAGALTTPRFLQRYTNTATNKNRRRAAAVFRIFLCDPMLAVVPPPAGALDRLLDRAFPQAPQVSEDDIRTLATQPDPHGTNQACAKCHYKLDPLGRAFLASAIVLAPTPSPGALVYRDSQQKNVNIPGAGLGEIASAIVRQPDYVRCQTRQFWNWFIGVDRPLSGEREEELMKTFEVVGRRTNDFIAELVSSPEFREPQRLTPEQARAGQVLAILRNCTSCHDSEKPDFMLWPIGGSKEVMRTWTDKIAISMDFEHDGANRKMPPAKSPWQPTRAEADLLRDWIRDGAPDATGVPQI